MVGSTNYVSANVINRPLSCKYRPAGPRDGRHRSILKTSESRFPQASSGPAQAADRLVEDAPGTTFTDWYRRCGAHSAA